MIEINNILLQRGRKKMGFERIKWIIIGVLSIALAISILINVIFGQCAYMKGKITTTKTMIKKETEGNIIIKKNQELRKAKGQIAKKEAQLLLYKDKHKPYIELINEIYNNYK